MITTAMTIMGSESLSGMVKVLISSIARRRREVSITRCPPIDHRL
jgi:hypothetical protein